MLNYLSDLMEDANDFSWHGAKAAHAVLMCDMERGAVTWDDTAHIDRVSRAHAQKQSGSWSFVKDHESNGKLHRHICANCLEKGRQFNHPEKDCLWSIKQSKNEQSAALGPKNL